MERLGDVENALHELRLTISDSHDETPLRNEDLADVEDRYTEHSNLMENIPFEIGDRDTSKSYSFYFMNYHSQLSCRFAFQVE